MSSDARARADASELLKRAGAHRWTRDNAIEALTRNTDLRDAIRKNLDLARKASAALLADDAAPGGADSIAASTLTAEAVLEVTSADAVRQTLVLGGISRQIAEKSREAADAIASAVELLEPINRATWTTFCALSIGQSVEELIRATLPTTSQHLDHQSWVAMLALNQLEGAIAGADELFSIAANYGQLWPKELETPERMSLVECLQGLGVLEAMSREWETDYIIAVNEGGAIVGNYVGRRLEMDKNRVGFVTFKDNRADLTGAQAILGKAGDGRVLIVDDISRTGKTMRGVHAALSGHSSVNFQCASLVSAVPDLLGGNSPYGFAAALTNSPRVTLPWETKGKLFVKADRYVLGESEGFPIMKSQAETIQQELGLKG